VVVVVVHLLWVKLPVVMRVVTEAAAHTRVQQLPTQAVVAVVDLLEIQLPTLVGLVEEETEHCGPGPYTLHQLRVRPNSAVAVVAHTGKALGQAQPVVRAL
jgi:hypothetical protein